MITKELLKTEIDKVQDEYGAEDAVEDATDFYTTEDAIHETPERDIVVA